MSFSSWSGVKGLQRLPSFKYYNVLKWGSRFILELNAVKIITYIKNNRQDSLNGILKSFSFVGEEKKLSYQKLSALMYVSTYGVQLAYYS